MESIELKGLIIINVSNFFYNIFFYNLDNGIPGPDSYKKHSLIGTPIFNSRYQSPYFYSCSQKLNIPNRNERNPGPGSYIRFSEFGILDPNFKKRKNQMDTEKTEATKNDENQNETNTKEEPKSKQKVEEAKNETQMEEKSPQMNNETNEENKEKIEEN